MRSLLLAADDDSGLPLYAYLFWTLFIVYVGWYGLRLYRRRDERRSTKAEPLPPIPPTGPSVPSASAPSPTERLATDRTTERQTGERPTNERPTGERTASERPATSTPGSTSTAAAAPRAPRPAATGQDSPGRTGFFAAAPSSDRGADRLRQPVAQVLKGITMPEELAPVINLESSDLSGLRVAFSAVGAHPGRVGRAIGDELERLGFTLQSLGDTQLGAQRDDDEVVVTIYTDPAAVERLGAKAFPLLPPGAFVVEFESV